jgi:septal ring factor EnvC (AmiA/AmiB activator)
MIPNKKIIIFAILFSMLFCSVFLLSGCTFPRGRAEVFLMPDSAQTQQNDSIEKRFQEPSSEGPTVVESAIELSKKYAEISKEATMLKQKNQDFTAENRQLEQQVAALKAQLQQAQKELTEANDLLIEMRIELNNWKADVIGFRNEMREAEKAQLQALLRILKVLGGEVRAESTQSQDIGSTEMSQTESPQLVSAENQISGETNE